MNCRNCFGCNFNAFNINNNEVQVSVIKFFSPEKEANLTKDKQYEEQKKDFDSKSIGAPDCHFFLID